MNIKSFFKLVELPTKITTMTTLIAATIFVFYKGIVFNVENFIYMLISLLAMDMVTTGLNNYIDYKKAKKKSGFGYEEYNAIVKYNIKEWVVVFTLILLSIISGIFGIILYLKTNIVVLIIGVISFGIGIIYTYGPIPISRTAFGEVFSGLFQGFLIVLLGIYIHNFEDGWILIELIDKRLVINLEIIKVMEIFLFSLPFVLTISNLMLANNICDMEDDLQNNRYTLPIFIGKEKALVIFKYSYYLCYVDIIILVILKIVPVLNLISLLSFIIVNKNIGIFLDKQSKRDTFPIAIKNFIIINYSFILVILLRYFTLTAL